MCVVSFRLVYVCTVFLFILSFARFASTKMYHLTLFFCYAKSFLLFGFKIQQQPHRIESRARKLASNQTWKCMDLFCVKNCLAVLWWLAQYSTINREYALIDVYKMKGKSK